MLKYPFLVHLLNSLEQNEFDFFAKSSTMYNPFIYSISHPRFRRQLQLLTLRYKRRDSSASATDETNIQFLRRSRLSYTTRRSFSSTGISPHSVGQPTTKTKAYEKLELAENGTSTHSSSDMPLQQTVL